MSYIAIQMYSKENKTCLCVRISEDGQFNIEQVIGWINVNQLGQFVIGNGLKPVNFSVDRNGTIKADCGDFSRFSEEGCGIVLAEIKSKAGRPLGYRLLSSSKGVVVNWTTPDIVAKAKSQKHPFLQNGIIRNDTVNCYPLHPFPVMEIGVQTKKRVTKSKVEMPKKKEEIIFTAEQKAEFKHCEAKGISSAFIQNPKLTPQQMRVLWVAKSKGVYAEAFANPAYSVDVMKFYADRLVTNSTVKECDLMLQHPELTPDKLGELYLCVCTGVDYSDLLDKSATNIMVERKKREAKLWYKDCSDISDVWDKAIGVAEKIRGMR